MTIEELEAELATRKGLAARVEAPGSLRNLAALLGIAGLFLVAGAGKRGAPALPVFVSCLAAGYNTAMDGLTKPLTCAVPVVPGEPVRIRIAVADASDSAYDSAIALLDGGIWSE